MLVRKTSGDYFKQWLERAKTDQDAAKTVARHHGRPEFELFDLKEDPYELSNVAGKVELKQVKEELFAELKSWIREQGDALTVFHEPLKLDAPETWTPEGRK
jgi:uncharacterized sulfatase